jgi:hypothetical protein
LKTQNQAVGKARAIRQRSIFKHIEQWRDPATLNGASGAVFQHPVRKDNAEIPNNKMRAA